MRRIKTKADFRAARLDLDLTGEQLAKILCVSDRTIRRVEDEHGKSGNGGDRPGGFPLYCRVLEWMLNQGFRPPEFKRRETKRGRPIEAPQNKVTTHG